MSEKQRFKIEHEIPIPSADFIRGQRIYPFMAMKEGDSFFIMPPPKRNSIYMSAKRYGIKITIRNEGNGYRVWRVG